MIKLQQVTLISLATRDVDATGKALEYSCRGIEFGAVKLVSPYRPFNLPDYIQWEHVHSFLSINEWNHYVVYNLTDHVDTNYCILVHNDGFIVNPESWNPDFLNYDYCGSPWSLQCAIAIQGGREQPLQRVGNSVSIRSKKLLELPSKINLEWKQFNDDSNEDTFLSCHNWKVMQEHDIKIAPLELAFEWGREEDLPEESHVDKPFVFHKWSGHNQQYPRF